MQSTLGEAAPEIRARTDRAQPRASIAAPRRAPETLHPGLWLGHQLGRLSDAVEASGFPRLDAELPGGGWPRRCLTELLLSHPGIGEMRLTAPALARAQARVVMLFDPPLQLDAAVLARLGFDLGQLFVVRT
jgi:protein ImuA